MELRQLRSFVAVGEHEHFGRAAKQVGIVQPALTRQIHRLEVELGSVLLEPIGRGVRLTAVGRLFLEDARRTIAEAERAAHRARLAALGQIGTLNVSFAEAATYTDVMPTILAEFRKRVPDVQLELSTLTSAEQWKALHERQMNVGFVYFLPTHFPELKSQLIGSERVVLAVPKNHRLSRKPKVLLRDLQNEPFVWSKRRLPSPYYESIAEACRAGGLSLNIVQGAPTESTMLRLVAQNVGLSFAAATRARQQSIPNIVLRDVEDLKIKLDLSVVWRFDDSSPALPKFLAIVHEVQGQYKKKARPLK